jgi:hypothetical protein
LLLGSHLLGVVLAIPSLDGGIYFRMLPPDTLLPDEIALLAEALPTILHILVTIELVNRLKLLAILADFLKLTAIG